MHGDATLRSPARRPARRSSPIGLLPLIAAVLLVLPLTAPAAADTYATTDVFPASGASPFASCDVRGFEAGGTNYVDTEVEPWIAANPTDPDNLIAAWQQDRWSNGGARGLVIGVSHDGGATWTPEIVPFSRCAGGTGDLDYERASDPWVTFAPDGTAYVMSLSFNVVRNGLNAMLVSRSEDGGDTWSEPVTLVRNDALVPPFLFNDKNSIAADPTDADFVYAVWDRPRFPSDRAGFQANNAFSFRGDGMLARTTDGGETWEPARPIFEPRSNRFTIGHQIAVTPDGTVVDIFDHVKGSGVNVPSFQISVMRSTDHGETWSAPIKVSEERSAPVFDPDTGDPVRAGAFLPDIAADLDPSSPGYGNLYAVWADSAFNARNKSQLGRYNDVVFTMSADGGLTWTPIVAIDEAPAGVQAFTASVHVAAGGTIGVSYYDFRSNTADPDTLPTDHWLIHCHFGDGVDCTDPADWSETHVAGPFDMRQAPVARGFFVGDYVGLTSVGDTFLPFFVQTTSTDGGNAYLARVTP